LEPATFYTRTRDARKVIVVDLGFLGDTVHLVPALWELKRHYARAALHVLTTPVGCEVLALVDGVDRRWALEMNPRRRSLRQQWQVLRALRGERLDVAYNFSGADRTIFITALTGARWRVAHRGARWHFWNRWLIPTWVPRRPANLPVWEQRRQVLAACGFTLEPPRFALRIPGDAVRRAESLAPPGAIHFSINASHALKEWPLGNWAQAAKLLLDGNPAWRIVATGSGSDREQTRLARFAAGVGHPRLTVLEGGHSVAELGALLQRCQLHVGADSGVLHLATALGTRVLALFREYPDASAWMPACPPHQVLSAPCRCVDQRPPPCGPCGYAECLAGIAPEVVVSRIRSLLDPGGPAEPLPGTHG
jgi:ADP-heptose:LPS heptosyltransferase